MKKSTILLLLCLFLLPVLSGCGNYRETEKNKLIAISSPGDNDGSNLNIMTDRLAELCTEGGYRLHYEMSIKTPEIQNQQLKNMTCDHPSAYVIAWPEDAEIKCFAGRKAVYATGVPVILMDLDAAERDPEKEAQRLYKEVVAAAGEN